MTFLFRGGEETRNVVIMVDRGLWGDILSNRMERLARTDVWHRTYRFLKDARFTYSLSVNDPLTPVRRIQDAKEWLERSANWRVDPLNPRRFPAYPIPLSVVELPGAPAQPWVAVRPEMPKGQVQAHKLKSTILDNLISEKRVPPLVAALVSHPRLSTRNLELSCSDAFTRFLAEELIPWLRKSFRITEDPGFTVIGGSSNGGLGAAFAAFRHPEIFGNVLSQSGAFMYSPPEEKEPEWLIRTNRHLKDILLAKDSWVHRQEFNGGHEYLNWRGTLAEGLIALLGSR